jgi:predicted GIY-YIG superfamily endonuclease
MQHLLTYRNLTVWLDPPTYYYVYLLHFKQKYHHAGHYLGATGAIDARLHLHRHHGGARLMEVIHQAGIDFDLARLWRVETWEESRGLERKLKAWHGSTKLCPICQGKPFDDLVFMRQGHWPFALHDVIGKRQPVNERQPLFIRRQ